MRNIRRASRITRASGTTTLGLDDLVFVVVRTRMDDPNIDAYIPNDGSRLSSAELKSVVEDVCTDASIKYAVRFNYTDEIIEVFFVHDDNRVLTIYLYVEVSPASKLMNMINYVI